jgi:hypothetical protein
MSECPSSRRKVSIVNAVLMPPRGVQHAKGVAGLLRFLNGFPYQLHKNAPKEWRVPPTILWDFVGF